MTESIDPADYPLPRGALPYLCDAETWRLYRAAQLRWMIAAKEIDAETRAKISKGNPMNSRRPIGRNQYLVNAGTVGVRRWPEQYSGDGGESIIRLSDSQAAAFEDFASARKALEISAKERIESGEIVVLGGPVGIGPCYVIGIESFKQQDVVFLPSHNIAARWKSPDGQVRIDGKWSKCRLRLLDKVGVPVDQALYAYADVESASEIERLEAAGAPDHIGRLPMIDRQAYYSEAGTRWRELWRDLKVSLLEKLRAGALVGTESGSVLPLEVWLNVDVDLTPALWRPGALVRPKDAGDSITEAVSRPSPGRPTLYPEIMQHFAAKYLQPNGALSPGKKKTEIARELLAWKNDQFPGKPPNDYKTIAGWIGEYLK